MAKQMQSSLIINFKKNYIFVYVFINNIKKTVKLLETTTINTV